MSLGNSLLIMTVTFLLLTVDKTKIPKKDNVEQLKNELHGSTSQTTDAAIDEDSELKRSLAFIPGLPNACIPAPPFPAKCKPARNEPYVFDPPQNIPYCVR